MTVVVRDRDWRRLLPDETVEIGGCRPPKSYISWSVIRTLKNSSSGTVCSLQLRRLGEVWVALVCGAMGWCVDVRFEFVEGAPYL